MDCGFPDILNAFEQALELERELGTRTVECDRALLLPVSAPLGEAASRRFEPVRSGETPLPPGEGRNLLRPKHHENRSVRRQLQRHAGACPHKTGDCPHDFGACPLRSSGHNLGDCPHYLGDCPLRNSLPSHSIPELNRSPLWLAKCRVKRYLFAFLIRNEVDVCPVWENPMNPVNRRRKSIWRWGQTPRTEIGTDPICREKRPCGCAVAKHAAFSDLAGGLEAARRRFPQGRVMFVVTEAARHRLSMPWAPQGVGGGMVAFA